MLKLTENAKLPTRNNKTDAGMDLYSNETIFIPIGSTKIIKTGVSILVPNEYVGKIEDRSSIASKGLRTGGGVVDSGYAGEICIIVHNITNVDFFADGSRGYLIKKGQKIAQLLLYKVETPDIVEIKEIWNSQRGQNGFGSSGA